MDVPEYCFETITSRVALEFAANVFNDTVPQQNFNLHFANQVIAFLNSEEAINLPLPHLLFEFQQLDLLKLLQRLVFLLEQFAFLLIDLGLDTPNLLIDSGIIRLGRLLLDFGDHPLPLSFQLLKLTVELVDLALQLLLHLFLPSFRHHHFDVDEAFE